VDLGCQVVSSHCWSTIGEESHVSKDAGCYPPPY
jgi:hypothetical protein